MLKPRRARERDLDVRHRHEQRPNRPGHLGRPTRQHLHAQRQRIQIRTIIRHHAQREQDQAEPPEPVRVRREQHRAEDPPDFVPLISFGVRWCRQRRGHDRCAEHLREQEREEHPEVRREEDEPAGRRSGLIARIIGRVWRPSRGKCEHGRCEREHRRRLRFTHPHGQVLERLDENRGGPLANPVCHEIENEGSPRSWRIVRER